MMFSTGNINMDKNVKDELKLVEELMKKKENKKTNKTKENKKEEKYLPINDRNWDAEEGLYKCWTKYKKDDEVKINKKSDFKGESVKVS